MKIGSFVLQRKKKSLSNVNQFFCGLHFLVGLADQAEACLKIWENLLFGNEKIGSLAHGGYSNGESGTTRLIRTVCKSVQEKGCEKSGRMFSFITHMKELGVNQIPLYPFLGNRFNILFLNGAGVFSLYSFLLDFFIKVETENKLLGAVSNDLKVNAYKAGCKALGLIDKLVTGPLWRAMIEEKTALNMTTKYQHMLSCFEKWANDPSLFLSGVDSIFPHLLTRDQLFDDLTKPSDIDDMAKQCLEIIFGGFVVVSKRMLEDHLLGGALDNPSENLKSEAKAVPTTNADSERDFGMLDHLMKLKPKALDLVYEGIIMFNRNKTGEWRDSLDKKSLSLAMTKARESKNFQQQLFFDRKKKIWKRKVEKFQTATEEKLCKQKEKALEKENLLTSLQEFGGLWSSDEIEEKLSALSNIQKKRQALKVQLSFRQKVLEAKCDKSLFLFLQMGKLKPFLSLLQI